MLTYLEMHVNGKTGPRDLMCRICVINYLKRIQRRSPDISDMTFEELLRAQIDKPVFRLPDGTATNNLRQAFRLRMNDTGLLKCPPTGQSRILYSFRHTYATFARLKEVYGLADMTFQVLLKAQVDKPVFRQPDETLAKNLRQTFPLLKCPRTGRNHTLYSLRHTYAKFALVKDGMDINALARQIGTSIGMIQRRYDHLTPAYEQGYVRG